MAFVNLIFFRLAFLEWHLSVWHLSNGCHNSQRNDTQHNDIQHNDTKHNDIRHKNKWNAILTKMTLSIMTECCYAECHLCWLSPMLIVTHNPLYAGCCGTLAFVRMIFVRMALMTKNKAITAKQKLCQCRTHAKS